MKTLSTFTGTFLTGCFFTATLGASLTDSDLLFLNGTGAYTLNFTTSDSIFLWSGQKSALRVGVPHSNIAEWGYPNANAMNNYSLAFGYKSLASGQHAYSMGNQVEATNQSAYAFGALSYATGWYSWTAGCYNNATASYATVIGGYQNDVTQNFSISFGQYNDTLNAYSATFGYSLFTTDDFQFIVGKDNAGDLFRAFDYDGDGQVESGETASAVFVVGDGGMAHGGGTNASESNAFKVYSDGSAEVRTDLVVKGLIYGKLAGSPSFGEGQSSASEGGEVSFAPTLTSGNRYIIDSYHNGAENVLRFRGQSAGNFDLLPSGDVRFHESVIIAEGLSIGRELVMPNGTAIASTDEWLRLNPYSQFSSGVYIPSNLKIADKIQPKSVRLDAYQETAHPNVDGALYKLGGQVHLAVDDYFYLRNSAGGKSFVFNTSSGSLLIPGITEIQGHDLIFGKNDGRDQGPSRPQQRALVHADPDKLIINFGGDFEGGTVLDGDVRMTKAHGGISMGSFN